MIPYKIKIDLEGQRDITSNVTLSVGDANGYGLVLEFYRNGKPYDITGYNLSVSALPAGATIPIPDVGTVEGGRGYYLIKPSMYAYAGKTRIEIILSDGSSSTVTKVLHFSVRSGFSSQGGSIVDEKDFTVLQKLIQQAQAAIVQAEAVVGSADAAKAAAEEARASAQKVKDDIQNYGSIVSGAYVSGDTLYITTSDGKNFAAGNVKGEKGDTGESGVHIGKEEPTDPEVKVWIDPTGHDGMREIVNILSRLKYKDGGVEVDLTGYVTEKDLEGKANSSHKHSASDITSGALPVARGGHGGTSVAKAQENLGLAYVKTGGTGAAYTASIEGITALKDGVTARIILHTASTTTAPTLNVNNLGAATIYRYVAGRTPVVNKFDITLPFGCPIELVGYNSIAEGKFVWVCTSLQKPYADDMDGVLAVEHGGHGGATAAQAQANLGLSYVTTAGTGEAYTVTIPGITELKKGVVARIIPHTVSTKVDPTLNVNGLGAKQIVRKKSGGTNGLAWFTKTDWLNSIPLELVYTGSYWVANAFELPMAEDIDGIVSPAKGGTGVTSLDALATAISAARVEIATYVGTADSSTTQTISFSFSPKLVIIAYKSNGDNTILVNCPILMSLLSTSSKSVHMAEAYDDYSALKDLSKSSDGKKVFLSTSSVAGNAKLLNEYNYTYYCIGIG